MKLLVLCLGLVSFSLFAQDYETLAKELAKQRSEVEQLNSEVSDKEEEIRQEMKTLAMQKAELESSIQKEELRQQQLLERKQTLRKKLADLSKSEETLAPSLKIKVAELKKQVTSTVPFKTQERLKAVEEIEANLELKKESPYKLANKLWSTIEDELRLSRENSLAKQNIRLDGQEYLADVAKLGMTNLYFKIDERFGLAVVTPEGWRFVESTDPKQKELIKNYFGQLKKQIRSGEFIIPGNFKLAGR